MDYYISSTNYTVNETTLKTKGKVYGTTLRVIQLNGKPVQKRFKGFPTKAALKTAVTEFITTKCQVVSPEAFRAHRVKSLPTVHTQTVSDLLSLYLTSLQNQNKDTTIYDKSKLFRLFVIPYLGTAPVDSLTKERLWLWQDEIWQLTDRNGEAYSYKYLLKVRSYFSAFLNWAHSRYGTTNNFVDIPTPKRRTPKTQMKFWTREQFDTFLAAVDSPMYAALFATLFFTGRRKGEVLALTPEDVSPAEINFSKSVAERTTDGSLFKITSTKAEKVYSSPICDPLAKVLAAYTPMSPYYFGGSRPIPPETLRKAFLRYTTAANLPQIRIHDLRHSFVSMIIHLGATLPVVADLIGDTLEQVTKTYAHAYETDKRTVIAAIK